MNLIRMIYVSTTTDSFLSEDVTKILDKSRVNNKRDNITGMLYFNTKVFIQCLEGPRTNVNNTYGRILVDPRHDQVVILAYDEITERAYGEWSMGFVSPAQLKGSANLKHLSESSFDPYSILAKEASAMMSTLKKAS